MKHLGKNHALEIYDHFIYKKLNCLFMGEVIPLPDQILSTPVVEIHEIFVTIFAQF